MTTQQQPRWRGARASAAFTGLMVAVLALGYLALTRVLQPQVDSRVASPGADTVLGIELDRFTARRERSNGGEQLSVSIRLRSSLPHPLSGYLFVVARNDHVSPRVWGIWPLAATAVAITPGGHFHGANPTSGLVLSLDESWVRVAAVVPHEAGQAQYDTVTIYFVTPQGQILLSRPFEL